MTEDTAELIMDEHTVTEFVRFGVDSPAAGLYADEPLVI